jgi:uncharacterized membrane protein
MKPRLWLNATLLAVALAGYPVAMHLLLTSQQWPATTLVTGLLPFAVLPLGLFKTGHRGLGLLSVALSVALLWLFWNTLLTRQDWIYLMQNAGMQTMMAWIFGRTLIPPQEPLISQIARRIHGTDYTPAIATYTRQATLAWVFFFVAMALISVILFAVTRLSTWSFFVNVLYLPLLALMFVLEYAARRYCLRDIQHLSITKGLSLYWERRKSADGKL